MEKCYFRVYSRAFGVCVVSNWNETFYYSIKICALEFPFFVCALGFHDIKKYNKFLIAMLSINTYNHIFRYFLRIFIPREEQIKKCELQKNRKFDYEQITERLSDSLFVSSRHWQLCIHWVYIMGVDFTKDLILLFLWFFFFLERTKFLQPSKKKKRRKGSFVVCEAIYIKKI